MAAALNVEGLLMGGGATKPRAGAAASTDGSAAICFPTEFPYEFDPVLELESAEESEDVFFAGLTRRLTQQQLAAKPERKRMLSGSPESTLCGTGSCRSVSSNGSPIGAPSPPTTPFCVKDNTLELIHAVAGEIARLKMATRNGAGDALAIGGINHNPAVAPTVTEVPSPISGAKFVGQNYFHRASEIMQYQKQSQLVGQQHEYLLGKQQPQRQIDPRLQQLQQHFYFRGGRDSEMGKASSGRPSGVSPTAWGHPLHPHHHCIGHSSAPAARAVYLGGSVGVKRERAGTGVFLPRKYGTNSNPDSSKKKTGVSPALLPARPVHALHLNFDDHNMQGLSRSNPRPNCGLGMTDYDVAMARTRRAAAILAQQKQTLRTEALINHELRLPQEWTY